MILSPRPSDAIGGTDCLPCLTGNNSIGGGSNDDLRDQDTQFPAFYDFFANPGVGSDLNEFSTSHKKSATALELNVHSFIERKGLNNTGFLTLTFPDHVNCVREASKRFNSLNTNFLRHIITGYIGVFERHKSGRIHFHLLTGHTSDIRTGLDFNAVANRDYRTANKALRSLWSQLRSNLHKYGFGRAELLPVKSNSKGLSKYISKYIAKAIESRQPQDKGFRLIRMSQDKKAAWKVATCQFSFVSPGSKKWRKSLKEWVKSKTNYLLEVAARKGYYVKSITEYNYSDVLSAVISPKWAFLNRDNIRAFDTQNLPLAA